MRKTIVSVLLVAFTMSVAAQAETLRIEGSTTVGPIADAFAEYFKGLHPTLEITVSG
jgi:ABC-type phosphate transport system substrate-binding protein